jgi:teichoic acid transport system ATP-binding protein
MTMGETTIQVDHVSKVYRLYEKPRDRIKEAFSLSRKVYYKEHYALQDVSFSVCRGRPSASSASTAPENPLY